MGKANRIRSGYYEYKSHFIEKKDERAEIYPGDIDYGAWTVTELWTNETWLHNFNTLREAKQAIDNAK